MQTISTKEREQLENQRFESNMSLIAKSIFVTATAHYVRFTSHWKNIRDYLDEFEQQAIYMLYMNDFYGFQFHIDKEHPRKDLPLILNSSLQTYLMEYFIENRQKLEEMDNAGVHRLLMEYPHMQPSRDKIYTVFRGVDLIDVGVSDKVRGY